MAEIDWIEVLNDRTGERGRISPAQFRLVPEGTLRVVTADQKPYVPELFKSKVKEPAKTTEEADDASDEED